MYFLFTMINPIIWSGFHRLFGSQKPSEFYMWISVSTYSFMFIFVLLLSSFAVFVHYMISIHNIIFTFSTFTLLT